MIKLMWKNAFIYKYLGLALQVYTLATHREDAGSTLAWIFVWGVLFVHSFLSLSKIMVHRLF